MERAMRTWTRIMALGQSVIVEFVWLISEIEALIATPNHRLSFRRLYFRLKKIKYRKHLWVGRGLRLLNKSNFEVGVRCALGDFVRIANHAPIT